MATPIAILPALTITTAVTGSASTAVEALAGDVGALLLTIDFVYGSGGTSGKAWVQTSLDGGTTWIDIACMTFLLASKKRIINLSSLTPVTTHYDPLEGTLADDTAKDGILGSLFRVKRTTVGTYAGGTTLTVSALAKAA